MVSKLCFSISPSGRLGNHMISFLRLIQLSKKTGIKKVFFPKNFLMQNASFLYDDIYFELENTGNYEYISYNCFFGNFYYPIISMGPLPLEINSAFRSLFYKSLKNISLPDDVLVINIRSGDVFTDKNIPLYQRKYGQPPCSYYKEVIQMRNWSDVIVTSETNDNPCVDNVMNFINKKFQKNSLIHDLSLLLNAKNLVVSRGTIGFSLILLSDKVKNLFMFNRSVSWLPQHLNCVPTDVYFNDVIRHWANTTHQRNLMLTSKCLKWEFIKNDPNNFFLSGNFI